MTPATAAPGRAVAALWPPSLLALRAFEAAARHLSFTDAARELHVSQAAVSRHVRGLEGDLGRPLFRRLHRRVQLTAPWRRWFAAAGLPGFDKAKHLYFNDHSLTLTATLRGQGVALSAPIYVRSQLRSGRLKRIGRTPVPFGDYWLLQAADRASAGARADFVAWFAQEIERINGKETAP